MHPSLKDYSPKELFRGNKPPTVTPTDTSALVPRDQIVAHSALPTQMVLYCGQHNTPIHTCCEPSAPVLQPPLSLKAPIVPAQLAVLYNGKYYLLPQCPPGPPLPPSAESPSVPQIVSMPQMVSLVPIPQTSSPQVPSVSRRSPILVQTQMTSEPPPYSPLAFAPPPRMTQPSKPSGSKPLNALAPLFSPTGSQPAPKPPQKKPRDDPAPAGTPNTGALAVSQRAAENKLRVNVMPVQTYETHEEIQRRPSVSGGSDWGTKSIWPLTSPTRNDNPKRPSKTIIESNRFGVDLLRETP